MNPNSAPPYRCHREDGLLSVEVEAPDYAGVLAHASLAVSDLVHPVGRFDTWSARRVAVRGATPAEMLERWIAQVLDDVQVSGFLPALVEVEKAAPDRADGIVRGGCMDLAARDDRPRPAAVVPGTAEVARSRDGHWRAKFALRCRP